MNHLRHSINVPSVPGATACTCAQLIETLDVGGAENLAVRIANGMAAAGHRSHLIVLGRAGPLARFVENGVAIHELGVERGTIPTPWNVLTGMAIGLVRLESIIRDQHIEVVQSHLPGANFWGLLLTLRRRVPVLATVHNNREFVYGNHDNRLRAHLRRRAYEAIIRYGAGTIAVSTAVKQSLVNDLRLDYRGADRISVVTNGVDVPAPRTAAHRDACRAKFGLPKGTVAFVAAGRHDTQKNFTDLVRAAASLSKDTANWCLVIAGDGPQRKTLMTQAQEAGLSDFVRFPGNVMEMADLLAAADVLVMSSLWEGLPLVLLEAMAAALPVVAPRIPGVEDVVTDGVEGLLVAPSDPRALAAAMATMIEKRHLGRTYGAAARETAARSFDLSRTIDCLSDLYRASASRAPGKRGRSAAR